MCLCAKPELNGPCMYRFILFYLLLTGVWDYFASLAVSWLAEILSAGGCVAIHVFFTISFI